MDTDCSNIFEIRLLVGRRTPISEIKIFELQVTRHGGLAVNSSTFCLAGTGLVCPSMHLTEVVFDFSESRTNAVIRVQ
jgi:hypothetical protein